MEDIAKIILNPHVVGYLSIIFLVQALVFYFASAKRKRIAKQRTKVGLPQDILMDHSQRLSELKSEALWPAIILIATIIIAPFVLLALADGDMKTKEALALTFAAVFLWLLWNGTDAGKAFLGGLVFKTLIAVKHPVQVGDRVTLRGYSGKITEIGLFYIILQTPDDDQISIPTSSLWSEVLVSTNAGARASLCVMDFRLAPFSTVTQRQVAEDTIWDAIQASTYSDVSRPMQIYISQDEDAIRLTAKAYVASTYNEALFKSDVYRAFFKFADEQHIPLSGSEWRREAPSLEKPDSE